MRNFCEKYNVSRETYDKLKSYEALVLEWNSKFNLISKSSEENIWERHILDSAQLCKFIPDTAKKLYDFGSGAGFPAIVLAILSEELYPNLSFKLIESIGKKATFLNTVKNELNLNIEIINDRIENIKIEKADIITSRAMASLDKLLKYAKPFCTKDTVLIFPKGIKCDEEINLAQKEWLFSNDKHISETDESGKILVISKLRRKNNG